MDNTDNPAAKSQKSSSPRFPAMSLPTAIEKTKIIWEKEGKHPARSAALATHWSLSEKSSALRSYLAALGHFGLIEQVGGVGTGEYRLTDRAIKILAGEAEERVKALRDAALQPKIYKQLWQRFNGELPSDANLESRLLIDFAFNKDSVRGFIKDMRATISFAGLDKVPFNGGKNEESESEKLSTGKNGVATTTGSTTKPPMAAGVRYLPIPLDIGNAPIPVGMSEEDFQLLLDTLELWKKKIVKHDYTTYHGQPPTKEELRD